MSLRDEMPSTLQPERVFTAADRHVRDLGARERYMHLCSLDHPTHFSVVAEITGEVAPEEFPPAFAAVQRRHPLLNVEILQPSDGKGSAALHIINRPIFLKMRLSSQDYDWKQEVERELTTRQPGSPGPLMRASILYRPNKAQVILTFHHAIADALSAAFIIRDLMTALNGYVILPLPKSRPVEALMAALPAPAVQGEDKSLPHLDLEQLRANATADIWRDFNNDRITISAISLSEVLTERIRELARANGTTVHGAICAAVALHVFQEGSAESCTIGSAIDLRSAIGVEEECGLFVVTGAVDFPRTGRDAFWALARQATEGLVQARSPAGVSANLRFMEKHIPADATSEIASGLLGRTRPDAFVSNIGKLSIPQMVGRLRLNAFWGPMAQSRRKRERYIGVSTLGNRLRLVQTSPHGVPSVLEAVRGYLNDAADAGYRGDQPIE